MFKDLFKILYTVSQKMLSLFHFLWVFISRKKIKKIREQTNKLRKEMRGKKCQEKKLRKKLCEKNREKSFQ